MSKLEVNTIEPQSGTTLTIGASGDTVIAPTGTTVNLSNATSLIIGVPYFRIYSSVATSVPDNASTTIALQSSTYDDSGFHDTTNNRIKVPSGYTNVPFLITWRVRMNYDSTGDNTFASCRVSGTAADLDLKFYAGAEGEVISYGGSFVQELSTDDYIDIQVFHDNATNVAKSNQTGNNQTFLSGFKIQV